MVAVREEAIHPGALDHGRVVGVRRQDALAVDALVGVADHREQRLPLPFAVDAPRRVEDLVPTMFGVGLGEHHEFGIGGVAAEPRVRCRQVVDLVGRERQAQTLVGLYERRSRVVVQVLATQGPRRGAAGQRREVVVIDNRFGHAIVQQSGKFVTATGCDPPRSRHLVQIPAHAPLDADHRIETAACEDIGGLARPGRDGSPLRHDDTEPLASALGQVAPRPV